MSAPMFRNLAADEIECRVAQAKESGVSLLLYKDARCDQNILDETVGAMNWQRSHSRDNANCTVSIWDTEKGQWIGKEDTGKESNTEAEKGLASDSFKRACFNWGIGRELYTAPFIWIKASDCTSLKPNGQRWQCFDSFEVDSIEIQNKRIAKIAIKNSKSGKICFIWTNTAQQAPVPKETAPRQANKEDVMFRCEECGEVLKPYKSKKSGEEIGVRRHCHASVAQFGKTLCIDCIEKMKKKDGAKA